MKIDRVFKQLVLYGMSTSPRRTQGDYYCTICNVSRLVHVSEGHVNKLGVPQRSIVIEDRSREYNWNLELETAQDGRRLVFRRDDELFEFQYERVRVDILAHGDFGAIDRNTYDQHKILCGQLETSVKIMSYYPAINSILLEGDKSILEQVAIDVANGGVAELSPKSRLNVSL